VQALLIDMDQQADDTVEKGLAANEAMIGTHRRLSGKVLAATEADLQLERAIVAKHHLGGQGPLGGHRQLGQQALGQRRLAGAELMPGAAAVKAAEGGGIGHYSNRSP